MSDFNNKTVTSSGKLSEKIVKVSENPKKVSTKSRNDTELIIKKGKVSELLVSETFPETKKVVETTPKVSTKTVPETFTETSKVSEKAVSETSKVSTESGKKFVESTKVSTKKKKMVPKQLANLQRGGKLSKKVVETVPETLVETPKIAFKFPVKVIVIMAFIAGGTLGFLGLWNWWKNQKKKESVDDVVESGFVPQNFSQDELDLISQYEDNSQ